MGAQWTERLLPQVPIGQLGHSMVYDIATQRTLMLGGDSWLGLVSQLWALDASGWQLLDHGQQPNAGLYNAQEITWDGDRDGVLWFGMGLRGGALRQTWLLAGDRWALVNEDQGPLWPNSYRMQWLPNRHRVILHQPVLGSRLEETWQYDGTTWSQIATAHLPATGAGFDRARSEPGQAGAVRRRAPPRRPATRPGCSMAPTGPWPSPRCHRRGATATP